MLASIRPLLAVPRFGVQKIRVNQRREEHPAEKRQREVGGCPDVKARGHGNARQRHFSLPSRVRLRKGTL